MRVAILGGGINGYCCAVQILEHLKKTLNEVVEVKVISEAFSPHTTGDGSAGFWTPYILGNTSTEKVLKWSKDMHDFLEQLWLSEDAGEAGICLLPVIHLRTDEVKCDDFYKDIVFGYMPLNHAQLEEHNRGRAQKFTHGVHLVTYTSEPAKLLPYLMKRFQANGGKVLQRKVDELQSFLDESNYDVIINCTGLGARNLVGDRELYPVRGQVTRVKANWMYCVVFDDSEDGHYIIPNMESVVLGGTHQQGDYNTQVTNVDKKFIIEGCRRLVPSLENAVHLRDWVGLRPGRDNVRLEAVPGGKKVIIHNYGHGGAGVTLSWGCAKEVLELLESEIKIRHWNKSKL